MKNTARKPLTKTRGTAKTKTKTPRRPVRLRPRVMKLKRILVPLDFSEHARKALLYAVKLGEQFGAAIDLVAVVEPVIYAEGMALPGGVSHVDQSTAAEAGEALRRIAGQEIPADLKWRVMVRMGSAYAEIVETARDRKTDLLIVTTHGNSGLTHFLIGSTAEKIIRHAPCPVLVVRDKEHDFV